MECTAKKMLQRVGVNDGKRIESTFCDICDIFDRQRDFSFLSYKLSKVFNIDALFTVPVVININESDLLFFS